jgi:hypothetical protein
MMKLFTIITFLVATVDARGTVRGLHKTSAKAPLKSTKAPKSKKKPDIEAEPLYAIMQPMDGQTTNGWIKLKFDAGAMTFDYNLKAMPETCSDCVFSIMTNRGRYSRTNHGRGLKGLCESVNQDFFRSRGGDATDPFTVDNGSVLLSNGDGMAAGNVKGLVNGYGREDIACQVIILYGKIPEVTVMKEGGKMRKAQKPPKISCGVLVPMGEDVDYCSL